MKKTALFVGRFQPLHLGHLSVIEDALKNFNHLVIGIGSSQESGTYKNPLTAKQREKIILATLADLNAPSEKYTIISIPDINNYELWPAHVIKLCPPFQAVITGSKIVKNCFENYNKNLNEKEKIKIVPAKKIRPISATKIKEQILKNDISWENAVPNAVKNLLESYKMKDILQMEKND